MFEIPAVLRKEAEVAGALSWLNRLPELVEDLSGEWGFEPVEQLAGGTESLVLGGTLGDGTAAVLKLLVPRYEGAAANEVTVLKLANGEGCPALYASDESRGAMLMERLGRPLGSFEMPTERRHEILTAAASRLWRSAPEVQLPTGADKGRWLVEFITETWEALGEPCSKAAVDHALQCAERRIAAHDDATAVLVHGDVHQWNALQAGNGFKLVDPDGLTAEPAYDMGILMREDSRELLENDPWERAYRLAELSGLDAIAIWEWGVVERLSTGLACLQVDLQPYGDDALRAAEAIAAM